MSVKELAHYTLPAATLADWLESQPDNWWSVDGDPLLTGILDFPCPTDEIAPAIRKIGKNLLVYDRTPGSTAKGEVIPGDRLDKLADADNWLHQREFLMCWADSDIEWLLSDDDPLV